MRKSTYKHTRKNKNYHGGDDTTFETSAMTDTETNVIPQEDEVQSTSTDTSLTEKLKGHLNRAKSYLASLTGGRKTKRIHMRKHNKRTHMRKHNKRTHMRKHNKRK
jgi:hypothetical protein